MNLNLSYSWSTTTMSTTNSTNLTSLEDNYYRWNFAFSVILAAILSITAFLAVVGNSMVLTVVIRHRGMRTRTNLFLVNLAVADLLVGAAVVPFAITTLIEGHWIFGNERGTFCTINGWLNCFCLVASIHTLMYISVHKHYSIMQPLASHFKLRQILGMMAAAWVWAAVSSTITVTGLSSVRYKKGTTQCGPEYPDGLKSYIFHAIIQVTNIFIPVVILSYCYTRMFREIRAHSKRLRENSTLEKDVILAQQKKVTITLFIVLAAFIICALPFHLYAMYTTVERDKHFSPYLNPMAYGSLYLNSALNPIIYAFRSPSFREGYKEILCQTPTYVISDDLATENLQQSPLRHRFSSFISSMRRSSASSVGKEYRSSSTSLNSLGSPTALIANPPSYFSAGSRRKGIAGLIRATRRSSKQSSIIRQNGDIIIVKGGKIVSIRRQLVSPGPPHASPLSQPFFASNKNGLEGGAVLNGHAPGRMEEASLDTSSSHGKVSLPDKLSSSSSVGSDNVFDDSFRHRVASSEQLAESPLEMISEERRLLSQQSEMEQVSDSGADNFDCQADSAASETSGSKEDNRFSGGINTDVGIIISIDEDNSILSVMPLTPRTRDRITRSDLLLDEEGKKTLATPQALKASRSAQGLCKRSFQRLPSVEHLDPPVNLRRSSSDYHINKGSRLVNLLQPGVRDRRCSFEKKSDSVKIGSVFV